MKKLVLAGLLMCLSLLLYAQKAPMKFGKVSMDEVAMEYYEADSSVDAAVLCEYGALDPTSGEFTWMIRYKVFTREGLNYLIMSIPAKSKSQIRGFVFNIENGQLVKTKITNESVYEERLFERYTRMRIAPPDAREGSVVDLKFTVRGIPWEWNFQKKIPVLWSELFLPYSKWGKIDVHFIGHEPLHLSSNNRWIARDMPAFKPEPYINSEKNYMTTMFMEITEMKREYRNYISVWRIYTESWDAVSDLFYKAPRYSGLLREPAYYLTDLVDEIQKVSKNDADRVNLALSYLHNQVTWNKEERLWTDPEYTLKTVFTKNRTGNSADMNFIFMQLLKKMDMECYPMAASLSKEGVINPMYPSISRFNYTLSYVKVDDRFFVIDAADKYYPYDMLNAECLNQAGFVIRKEKGEWVDIVPEKVDKEMINCTLEVNEDGIMEGQINVQYAEYASSMFRKKREQYSTEDEYLEYLENEHPGLYIADYQSENLDSLLGPVKENYYVEIDGFAGVNADVIQVDPVVLGRLSENPFKTEARRFPVNFGYGKSKMYILNLNLPEGYEVEQLPAPINLVNSDKSAVFRYSAAQNGNMIQVMYQLSLKKPVFLQQEYEELRSFYQLMVMKESETIILKKVRP